MVEKKRGLPESFSLDVGEPVELGDYLDQEDFGAVRVKPNEITSAGEEKEVPKNWEAKEAENSGDAPVFEAPSPQMDERKSRECARKQVNMKPETFRKADELLKLVRERGSQRDAAASEMFEAMVMVFYEAREAIDLSSMPKRGRWGTPTAEAFIARLSGCLRDSVRRSR